MNPPDSVSPAISDLKRAEPGSPRLSLFLFSLSMFLSAALLFVVEPMLGKMLMPLLGGTPAVWNTCVVFFQIVLLAGYAYAHAAFRLLSRRKQIALHLIVVSSPLLIAGMLPLHLPAGWEPPVGSNPAGWVLLLLLVVVGIPFFALSATTSVVQRWFADSGRRDAKDPYFLYAASNAGSLLGLLAYPLLLEPLLRLHTQSRLWSLAYAGFFALIAACGILDWRWRRRGAHVNDGEPDGAAAQTRKRAETITWSMRRRWIAQAFIPSSIMLGATSAITADVPAIPLFWVLPLAVYLGSFVLVFARETAHSAPMGGETAAISSSGGTLPGHSQTRFSLAVLLLVYLTRAARTGAGISWRVGQESTGGRALDRVLSLHLRSAESWEGSSTR